MRLLILPLIALGFLPPISSTAEVIENVAYETYQVRHAPGKSLGESLNAAAPFVVDGQKYNGYANGVIKWHFQWSKPDNGDCAITSVTTTLDYTVTSPELATADSAARSSFENYRMKLLLHEDGHLRISRETAERIDSAIQTMAPEADCRRLEARANSLGHSLLKEDNQRHRDYDRATGHGKTQGAWLP